MTSLSFQLHSAGVVAPGLTSLADLQLVARGMQPYSAAPLVLPALAQLPSAERRRASQAVRLTLACVAQALEASPFDSAQLRSVFATDEGTGEVCQQMLQALATTGQLSPMLFTNSVHNAPSGYFSIAWRNQQPATVVSLGLESFACGLLCAVTDAMASRQPVLLAVCDPAMTAPMDELLPIAHGTAAAFVITAGDAAGPAASLGCWRMTLQPPTGAPPSPLPGWLPAEWSRNSSARALAALCLLEEETDKVVRFSVGGQVLALWREGRGS
ncbi:MAG TPA: beta-ketoacyl synthase chain length factor [Ramlibacter sp.]|nr:beta-ketoacyl synthase chain length factor [Ramlibacter sp.]